MTNSERNSRLYQEWAADHTIEEASENTGIPMSTVGYYYKKFDTYARAGRPIPVNDSKARAGDSSGGADLDFMDRMTKFWSGRDALSIVRRIDELTQQGKSREALELAQVYEKRNSILDGAIKDWRAAAGPNVEKNVEIMAKMNAQAQDPQVSAAPQFFTPEVSRSSPVAFNLIITLSRKADGLLARDHSGRLQAQSRFEPVFVESAKLPRKKKDMVVKRVSMKDYFDFNIKETNATLIGGADRAKILQELKLWDPYFEDGSRRGRRPNASKLRTGGARTYSRKSPFQESVIA